ncbi:hypothetical protein ACH47C_25805 [Streptomyces rishiriensis]|uniref:hypothetical protein n=1 Tax=Streptomyces rishiriensis TaxID=68264 RepID=UPI0034107E60
MTDTDVLGSTNTDLAAYAETPPQREETLPGREFGTVPGGKGTDRASAAARRVNQAIPAAHAGGAVSVTGAGGPFAAALAVVPGGRPAREALTGAAAPAALSARRAGASASTPYRCAVQTRYAS